LFIDIQKIVSVERITSELEEDAQKLLGLLRFVQIQFQLHGVALAAVCIVS